MSIITKSIAYSATTSFILLAFLSPRSRKARFYLNAFFYVGGLGVCSVWGVIVSILMSCIPGQRLNINKVVARSFYYLTGTLTGVRFKVEGEHHLDTRPAVLVGNHQTSIDILYLGRIFPNHASIMAKQELKYTPLLGQFMALSGAVFINRKDRKDSIKAFAKVGDDMKRKNLSLWVFPEGTRSNLPFPDLLPFKKGAFHLAVQAGVPIIPVVCENYNRIFDGKTRFESGTVRIKVLPPIPTDKLTSEDVTELTNKTREQMLDVLKEMDRERESQDLASPDADQAKRSRTALGGFAGLMSKIVGVGSGSAQKARLDAQVKGDSERLKKQGTSGEKAEDYGLVTEKDKAQSSAVQKESEEAEISKRASRNSGGSGSSVEETDEDGAVVVKRPPPSAI
ncbi:1-acylglycerol-3-phosphate O [Violaceomyces palustris]|uniref:1-acylglycerol-3-phosphate O n=1 Tax=Violaceomyces palustris TaxID=1673888 RepID=A0ACD0P8F3_9BASI|nr:1-acylglycerol-3-phosphate O [Violaceomyces palustris]